MTSSDQRRFPPLGIIGLGTMGRNLALNLLDHGVPLHCWERDPGLAAAARSALSDAVTWRDGPTQLAQALDRPRAILLMVNAGDPVDTVIEALHPVLEPGDVIVDGGNSRARDTARRQVALARHGLHLIGLGVSGGEEGARYGPAMMAGGDAVGWARVQPALEAIAARAPDGAPCCLLMGSGAAGHFVKTVHNGIEYAIMQALAESYDLMRRGLGMEMAAIAGTYDDWNAGPLASFLVEISADVVRTRDDDGSPLLDRVIDRAGQKGTGRWASQDALNYGEPAPTIAEAVFARAVSARRDDRQALARPRPADGVALDVDALQAAVRATSLSAFVQGFDLIQAAARAEDWGIRLRDVASVWRAGCILRAAVLDSLAEAAGSVANGQSMLRSPIIDTELSAALPGLRRTVAAAAMAGLPVPAMASALSWFDGMTRERSPADFLQGLRDRFGAHGFERTDRPGAHHADWKGR